MFKALMAIRLRAFWAHFSGVGRMKKPSPVKTVLFVLLMLYCIVVFAVMFFGVFATLGAAYLQTELAWLFFALFLLLSFALTFLGSLFTAKAQLFEAKDNELLLALPIASSVILASRMVTLGLLNLLFELIVGVPFLIAWMLFGAPTAGGILLLAVVLIVLNLFCLAAASLFGWALARITARMRRKTLVSTLFSLLFLGAYFYVISRANALITAIAQNGEKIASSLGAFAPLRVLSQAMATQDFAAAAAPLAAMVLIFAAVYALLSCTFIKTAAGSGGGAKVVYRQKALKVSSADAALLGREWARLLSSSGYILNAGLGAFFCLAAAVILPFAKDKMLAVFRLIPLSDGALQLVVVGAICMLQSTITFSASSVSLEGETFWILRSLPISAQQILNAKLQLHTRIAGFAAAAAGVSAALCLQLDPVPMVPTALFFAAFCARIGLIENLRHPYFAWTNEMQAVKQGISVLLSMLITFAAIALPAGAYFLLQRFGLSNAAFLYGVMALYALLDLLLGKWLKTRGAAMLEGLS